MKNNFRFIHNLNSTNLPIRTADIGIKIVPESQRMNFTRFGFTVGGFVLDKRGAERKFGSGIS
jgi:hypothetical protein